MAGLPVATDWQSEFGQLGFQHCIAVATALAGKLRKHGGIAGQFLIEAKPASGIVNQRIEPEQAAQPGGQRLRVDIAAGQMSLFVRQHKLLLVHAVALLKIRR